MSRNARAGGETPDGTETETSGQTGTLSLVPTPIGNLGDITLRALEALKAADVVACEDTRRTGLLLHHYGIADKKLLRFFEHNEEASCGRIVSALREGKNVCLCTDGGMPAVSDPGFRAVRAAREAGLPVTVLPGPSAALTALVASGLPVAGFAFRGFSPRKPGKLRRFLETEKKSANTLIFFESPYRVGKFLTAALEVFGARNCAVCRELTKLHEEVKTGTLAELAAFYSEKETKGEITVVIEGNADPEAENETEAEAESAAENEYNAEAEEADAEDGASDE